MRRESSFQLLWSFTFGGLHVESVEICSRVVVFFFAPIFVECHLLSVESHPIYVHHTSMSLTVLFFLQFSDTIFRYCKFIELRDVSGLRGFLNGSWKQPGET